MRECGGCQFCCWSFAVLDVPDAVKGIETQPALTHCQHECSGCAIHEDDSYPPMCKEFVCPFLQGENIHRPDTFQGILERMGGDIGNYIPVVFSGIPVQLATNLIEFSRSLPAAIMVNNEWVEVVLPLDRDNDSEWHPVNDTQWAELRNQYE